MGSPRLVLPPFRATCVLLLLCITPYPATPQRAEILTNDAIVKMVKSGIGAPLIIQMIQTQPGSYVVTPSTITTLKQQGVSEAILSAMLAKQPAAATPSPAPLEKPEPAPESKAASGWQVKPVTDVMSDAKSFRAELVTPTLVDGAQVGNFEVTATCNPEILSFKILFVSPSDIGFKQNYYGHTVRPGLVGAVVEDQKPRVNMRVRIDQDPPANVSSEVDYKNEAEIFFTSRTTQQAFSAIDEPVGPQPRSRDQQLSDFVRLFAASKGAGSIAEVVHAQSLLIELPLANGTTTILAIKPQDPSFKAFSSRCTVPKSPVSAEAPETTTPRPATRYLPPLQIPEQKFNGTSASFADALPGLMEQKLKALGADTNQFDAETKYIGQLVKTCASITPKMIEGVTDRFGRAHLEQLGEEYKLCSGGLFTSITPLVKPDFKPGEPLVMLMLPDMSLWKFNRAMKARFTSGGGPYAIKVSFTGLRNSNLPADSPPMFVSVVSATLQ